MKCHCAIITVKRAAPYGISYFLEKLIHSVQDKKTSLLDLLNFFFLRENDLWFPLDYWKDHFEKRRQFIQGREGQ